MGWTPPWAVTQQTIFCFTVSFSMLEFGSGFYLVQPARMSKRLLNQADSLLMTKMHIQTDEVQGSGDVQTHCLLQYSLTCEREEEAPAHRKCC